MSHGTDKNTLETGLIGGVEKRSIVQVPHDREWKWKFKKHRDIIASTLGRHALRIEHIGSTSVPHLSAKPIIDILLVVKDSSREETYLPALIRRGYELRVREPDFEEHRMLRTREKDVHIHVLSEGSPEIDRYLSFRNRLRAHPEVRNRYQALKRRLARADWADINEYADAKSDFIEAQIRSSDGEKKKKEAQRDRWVPRSWGRVRD